MVGILRTGGATGDDPPRPGEKLTRTDLRCRAQRTSNLGWSKRWVRPPSLENSRRPDVSASSLPTGCSFRHAAGKTWAKHGLPRSSFMVECTPTCGRSRLMWGVAPG
eukprot:scaffold7923_cov121-Isochrysis_galbana.AAC.4